MTWLPDRRRSSVSGDFHASQAGGSSTIGTLSWPRGEKRAAGATLYLRCVPGHNLALQHEAPRIAAAINRYFGYVLVDSVRLSAMPLEPTPPPAPPPPAEPDPIQRALIARTVNSVADPSLKEALRHLGHALATKRR